MRTVAVVTVVLCGLSLAVFGAPVDALSALIDDDCITGEEAATFFTQLMTCCADLAEITDCLTIERLSTCLFDALGLRGTFLESLFGFPAHIPVPFRVLFRIPSQFCGFQQLYERKGCGKE